MGSKSRIIIKLRQSGRFKAVEAELDRLGLTFSANAPTGSGHPFLLITIPGRVEALKYHVPCTPHERVPLQSGIADLRRTLRAAGVEC